MPKSSKMLQFLNWRVRITIQENRFLEGKFLAFDKHMNVVLSECCEFRRIVPKGKKKSTPVVYASTSARLIVRPVQARSARRSGCWASFCCVARMLSR
jgi:small nuclear ribonucleoprotein B and B'